MFGSPSSSRTTSRRSPGETSPRDRQPASRSSTACGRCRRRRSGSSSSATAASRKSSASTLSALANAACLAGEPRGYLVFGIDDETHEVVGTDFDPYTAKAKGNQDLLPWLAARLRPNTGSRRTSSSIPAAASSSSRSVRRRDQPVSFYGTAYVRVGTSKTELAEASREGARDLDAGQRLVGRGVRGRHAGRPRPRGVAKAREQFVVEASGQAGGGGRAGTTSPSSTRPGS